MAINQTATTSFKLELPQAIHALLTDTLKMALYIDSASLGEATTVYTASGEAVGGGYVAGGLVLTGVSLAASGTTVFLSFNNPSWAGSLTARGALVYNSSKANRSIFVLDFGGTKTSAPFVVRLPGATATTAVLRLV